jgi:hypothetical protein
MSSEQNQRDANVTWAVALANSRPVRHWGRDEREYFIGGCIALVKTSEIVDLDLPLTLFRMDKMREFPTIATRLLRVVRHRVRRMLEDFVEAEENSLFDVAVRCTGSWTFQIIDGEPKIRFLLSCRSLPRQFVAEVLLLVAHTIASNPVPRLRRCPHCDGVMILAQNNDPPPEHSCRSAPR